MKTAAEKMLQMMLSGEVVGTSLDFCKRIGTKQVPDIARKLKNRGIEFQTEYVWGKRNKRNCKVARYSMLSALQNEHKAKVKFFRRARLN